MTLVLISIGFATHATTTAHHNENEEKETNRR
jgi:hypothetical protein